jgi:hypothetical protein
MPTEHLTGGINGSKEAAFRTWLVDLFQDAGPHPSGSRILGSLWLALNAHEGSHRCLGRCSMTTEQNYRRSAVTRDIRSSSVNDMGDIPTRQKLLNDLLPKLPLHEGVRSDHTYESGRRYSGALGVNCEIEKPLFERHCQGVLHVAGTEPSSVRPIEVGVFHCNVRWVTDDGMILLTKKLPNLLSVLYIVVVLKWIVFKCTLNSKLYKSLSAIAREVTGTKWNGFLFFGCAAENGGANEER